MKFFLQKSKLNQYKINCFSHIGLEILLESDSQVYINFSKKIHVKVLNSAKFYNVPRFPCLCLSTLPMSKKSVQDWYKMVPDTTKGSPGGPMGHFR